MADVEPTMTDVNPAPVAASPITSEGNEGPSWAPETCSEEPKMEQPPPYDPNSGTYPAVIPTQEADLQLGYQSTPGNAVPDTPSQYPQESCFDDKTVRRAFIRKVFCIVTIQMLVTFGVVCLFSFCEVVRVAVHGNIWILVSAMIVYLVVALCLICCRSLSRLHPWNLVALAVVTLSLSYMVGCVASMYSTTAVVSAMGLTLAICVGIIVFSVQTKIDFTVCNGLLFQLLWGLIMFGFLSIFFYSRIVEIIYGTLGALLFSVFLLVDCQLVMGRQTYALDPEEYVFAALILYLDMVNILLYILMIFGGGSKS